MHFLYVSHLSIATKDNSISIAAKKIFKAKRLQNYFAQLFCIKFINLLLILNKYVSKTREGKRANNNVFIIKTSVIFWHKKF